MKDIVKSYNNTIHRGIGGMTPNMAEQNQMKLRIINENKYIKMRSKYKKRNLRKPVIKIGDHVRLRINRTTFHRNYLQVGTNLFT